MSACQCRTAAATRHWHGAAATTLTGSLRRFVTGDPATAALGGKRHSLQCPQSVKTRSLGGNGFMERRVSGLGSEGGRGVKVTIGVKP